MNKVINYSAQHKIIAQHPNQNQNQKHAKIRKNYQKIDKSFLVTLKIFLHNKRIYQEL